MPKLILTSLQKKLGLAALILVFILLICSGLFQLSKLRGFQVFGELINRVETSEKVVALTFDDAPAFYADEVLKTLQERSVPATFYAIGKEIEAYPEQAKRIVEQGHELGNHSYSHKRFLLKSQTFIDQEISKTNTLIRQTGYTGKITFRPPNGKKLFGLPWYLHTHQIPTITWDVEPDTYGSSTAFLIDYTLEHTKPGSIILMHPFCASCQNGRQALGPIIDGLQAQGYRLVTVADLLKFKNGGKPESTQFSEAPQTESTTSSNAISPIPEPAATVSSRISLAGTVVCLPHIDQSTQTKECAIGLKTNTDTYYSLDFNLLSSIRPDLRVGEPLNANGIFTPIEMLSSEFLRKTYPVRGIFSVTDLIR